MLIATATIAYSAFSIGLEKAERAILKVFLAAIITTIVLAHIARGESTIFQLSWVTMVILVFVQCTWLLKSEIPAGRARQEMSTLATWGTSQ